MIDGSALHPKFPDGLNEDYAKLMEEAYDELIEANEKAAWLFQHGYSVMTNIDVSSTTLAPIGKKSKNRMIVFGCEVNGYIFDQGTLRRATYVEDELVKATTEGIKTEADDEWTTRKRC